jgi:hypothetical protein
VIWQEYFVFRRCGDMVVKDKGVRVRGACGSNVILPLEGNVILSAKLV